MDECPTGKGSGRTKWMVDVLVDAIASGQPKAMVIGHNQEFCRYHLKPRIVKQLEERGFTVKEIRANQLEVDGSIIYFMSKSELQWVGQFRGFGEFWDHHAEEKFDDTGK